MPDFCELDFETVGEGLRLAREIRSMHSLSEPFAIVMCTFNGEAHVAGQLRTLRQQAGVAEIVVCDDASTDGTPHIIEVQAAADPRIRLVRNERTLGIAANFAKSIGLVRSPWVALSDQDDIWLPDKLARMRAAWDGRSCLMHHATRKFRGCPPRSLPSPAGERRKFSGDDFRRLLYRNSVVGHTTLARTETLRRLMPFPDGVPHDWWIGLGAARLGTVQYFDEYLVHYRIHQNNAYHPAGSRRRRMRQEHDLRVALLQALLGQSLLADTQRSFVRDYLFLLRRAGGRWFSRPLWHFYRAHSGLFFNEAFSRSRWMRRERKILFATLGPRGSSQRDAERHAAIPVSPWA